jgi:hypothetical protein
MLSHFFFERYAHERHQAHLCEAAYDRLQPEPRGRAHMARGGRRREQAALVLAAIVAEIALVTVSSVGLPR